MNESLTTQDGRHTLRMERRFPHPPEKVWRAITDPAQLSQWWPLEIDQVPLEEGAPIRFYEGDFVSEGVITVCEPGRAIGFRDNCGVHENRFELEPDGDGTRMVFTHSFPADEPAAQHATGWHICFTAMAAVLDEREVPPLGYDPELKKKYDEILGTGGEG